MHKLHGQYLRLDWLALWPRTGHHGWVEVKCRNVPHDKYKTLMVSAMKWSTGVQMAQTTGGLFIIVAAYTDCDRVYAFDPAHLAQGRVWLEWGGRTAMTRDSGDIEPVMHVPASLFTPLP